MLRDSIEFLCLSQNCQTKIFQLQTKPHDWFDAAIYAPAMPGVIVALLGLYVAHRFSVYRERRQQVLSLISSIKELIAETETACGGALMHAAPRGRPAKIFEAKSKLQALGMAATNLKRKTKRGLFTKLCYVFSDQHLDIDVVRDVARLRDLVTGDPFEDDQRGALPEVAKSLTAAIAQLIGTIDERAHHFYG